MRLINVHNSKIYRGFVLTDSFSFIENPFQKKIFSRLKRRKISKKSV